MTRTLDYSALTKPTTRAEVKAFTAESKASGSPLATSSASTVALISIGAVVVVFALVTTVGRQVAGDFDSSGNRTLSFSSVFPFLIIAAVGGFALLGLLSSRAKWERWMRLTRFAAANQLAYTPTEANPEYPGTIFGVGSSRVVSNRLRSITGRHLDIGSYQYTTGSGKSRQTHNWGFMALRLDRRLPNMMLDSKANNGWFGSNLPSSFDKDQVLSLEGDFNEYFTLYCPQAYERDALYVFTPDLMALLIDNAAPFDVEIVDDWMFVYSSTAFKSTDPSVYQRLFRIVDTVGTKTLSQTDRYVDDRVDVLTAGATGTFAGRFASNTVAPQGQRLKKSFPIGAVIAVLIFSAIWLAPRLMEFFGR